MIDLKIIWKIKFIGLLPAVIRIDPLARIVRTPSDLQAPTRAHCFKIHAHSRAPRFGSAHEDQRALARIVHTPSDLQAPTSAHKCALVRMILPKIHAHPARGYVVPRVRGVGRESKTELNKIDSNCLERTAR